MPADFNDTLLLRALRREPTPRRPIWLMRQAGRYLPEYRRLRKDAGSFLAMVKNPELACEITLQPIRRFDFDAAIIFSDILIVPDAMRLDLQFIEGEGPKIFAPLRDDAAVKKLSAPPADAYSYLFDACALTRQNLPETTPLIGFAGAPWTLACYAVDGGGGAFWQTRAMLRQRPQLLHDILSVFTDSVITLLIGQLNAGCQVAMLFDSWGGLLPDHQYEEFSLAYLRRIIAEVKCATAAPVIVFARQAALSLPALAASGADALGVDWQTAFPTAQKLTGHNIALQGNMDPAVLLTDPDTVRREAQRILTSYGQTPGHIFNLGHGVDKQTPVENVAALAKAVREIS